MKIAFVVSFFDFRNDVRRVILEVAKRHEVVVLGKPELAESMRSHLPAGVEFRIISERRATAWNYLWERAYLMLLRLPRSRANFFLVEVFRANYQPTVAKRTKALRLMQWKRWLPKIIPYDLYLKKLQYRSDTQIGDIDHFYCFTAIADDYLLARLIKEKKNVGVYVYSWDHPCKHTCFSKYVQYLVWNDSMRQDLVDLQGISASRVEVVGASQFGYIEEFCRVRHDLARTYPFRYVYMGCATGIPELVMEEVAMARRVAGLMAGLRPDLKLVVRPYPHQVDWTLYDELRTFHNVIIDDGYRNQDLSVKENHIMEKFEKLDYAEAFLHMGTTMGLEACLVGTPSFILDFEHESRDELSMYSFVHQYQNDRHLINIAPQNAIRSERELADMLKEPNAILYQKLNEEIKKRHMLKSFSQFAEALTSAQEKGHLI